MPYDYTKSLETATHGGMGCAHCGTSIKPGDKYADCADCGAIFCEKCVRDGILEHHDCEDYDWDDDYEDDEE